jgi:L-ascorbate metabolism protein UlaG (beta-lactamase superfamily)
LVPAEAAINYSAAMAKPLFTRRRLLAGLAAVLAGGGGLLYGRSAFARYYNGPVSDHFDGVRFFDPDGLPPKRFTDLLRWWAAGGRAVWPQTHPSPFSDRPPARVAGSDWRIAFVGHASLLLQTAGVNILLDPVWSERASPFSFFGPKRVNEPGIPFDALPPIDVVLVSHCHYDHLDLATLSRLTATHRPRVITPLGNDTIMRSYDPAIRAEAFDWHDRVELGRGLAVTLVPVQHWSARGVSDRNKALWAGFVLETPAGRIFHAGDSGYGGGRHFRAARQRYGPFRLAMLPIGAYEPRWFMSDQHMNPGESVRALQALGAERALAHHYGTFQLTDEAIEAPAQDLTTALQQSGLAADRFRVLQPGEVWML